MRRRLISTLILVCSMAVASSCVKVPRQEAGSTGWDQEETPETASRQDNTLAPRININTAPVEELEKLPGIGRALAARIVAHREQYGRFRRAEHLIMVRGIGDRRFRKMRAFITAE